jgi:hypothetical protein
MVHVKAMRYDNIIGIVSLKLFTQNNTCFVSPHIDKRMHVKHDIGTDSGGAKEME